MKKHCAIIGLICVLFFLVNCGPQYVAPTLPNGDPILINLKIDPNLVDSLTVDHQNARKGLANWMEKDLDKMFRKAKYKTQIITPEQELPAEGYVVNVKFIKVHFQNKAARFFVGIAAGPALLDVEYSFKDGDKIIFEKDPDVIDSVKGDRECAHHLNNQIFKEVHTKMQEVYAVK